MNIDDKYTSVLRDDERVVLALRGLCMSCGFSPYRMSKFEEYNLYAENRDFLASENVITFTDTDGKLMALKPDVTLSIIKNSADEPDDVRRVFYDENIYRVSKGTGTFRELRQVGAECFGRVGTDEICDVLKLAAKSLRLLSTDAVLAVSDLGILTRLAADCSSAQNLFTEISRRNMGGIDALCGTETASIIKRLLSLHGPAAEVIGKFEPLANDYEECRAFADAIRRLLDDPETAPLLHIDFSVTGDINYYSGIVFKGFLRGIPSPVLSGGQYDGLMRRLGRRSRAIGFAVYIDELNISGNGVLEATDQAVPNSDNFVNVALPKGRLGESVYAMFAEAGFECPAISEPGRRLIFENTEKRVRYFWVKPSDVPIYVERGAADIGVAGKDILLEYAPDVYELLDLGRGVCRVAVAAPKGYKEPDFGTQRVATKFANIAKEYYRSRGRDIDIIHLNGSIELAPLLGLSDVIVDIVETGTTLRENDLEIVREIVPVSARLIANKSSFRFKAAMIGDIAEKLARIRTDEHDKNS